jgi:hypothetical protein
MFVCMCVCDREISLGGQNLLMPLAMSDYYQVSPQTASVAVVPSVRFSNNGLLTSHKLTPGKVTVKGPRYPV